MTRRKPLIIKSRNLKDEKLYQCHDFYEFIEGLSVDDTCKVLDFVKDFDLVPVTKDVNPFSDVDIFYGDRLYMKRILGYEYI